MGDITNNNDDIERKREEAIRKREEARQQRQEASGKRAGLIGSLGSETRNLANDFFRLLASFKEIEAGKLYQFNANLTDTYQVKDLANSRISACLVSLYAAAENNNTIKEMFKTMSPEELNKVKTIFKNADLSTRYNKNMSFEQFHKDIIAPPKVPEKKVTIAPEVKAPEIKKPPEVKRTPEARRTPEPKSRSERTIKTTNRFPTKDNTKPKYQVAARGPDQPRLTRPPKSPVVSNKQQEDRQRKYTAPKDLELPKRRPR